MDSNKISIKIGGPAGSGVFTIGLLLCKFFQKIGLEVVYTTDYPSLIKGGHNTCSVRVEKDKINAENIHHDILVALDEKTIREDLKYLNKGGILIITKNSDFEDENYTIIKIDSNELSKEIGSMFKNTIAYGAVIGVISNQKEKLQIAINSHFKKKSDEIKNNNIKAAQIGFDYSQNLCSQNNCGYIGRIVEEKKEEKTIFLSGNDAAALGALKAGVKFVAEYPMTPSSSFLSFFAARELEYNITTKHTEDELAAMNMVIGASIAGVRAMTATSGGGFALMNEALGFAGIGENPLVCFECQRAGPSTGIPTYTDQGDLKFVINSSQGEFPIVVLAPGDVEECFYEGFDAFNIADLTQTPVIVLLDKHLAATHTTVPKFETSNLKIDRGNYIKLTDEKLENYKRHEFVENGISKRCCLGQDGGIHVNSSYEHDEKGWTCEDGQNHIKMQEKRFKKLESIPKDKLRPKLYGLSEADLTIVGWGSTKTSVIDAIKFLNQDGYKVNYLHFIYINPMDNEFVKSILENCNDTIMFEGNFTAQLRGIIRENTGFYIEKTFLKYDGRPYYYEEIYNKIKEILEAKK